jgi:hypothetical protein
MVPVMGMPTLAALATVTGLLAAGCAVPPGPATTGRAAGTPTASPVVPTAPPTVSGYAYTDPDDVCGRFAAALFSIDTTIDAGPVDATRRAAGFADAGLAARLVAAGRDGRWETWRLHHARIHAAVSAYVDDEQPPDTSVAAYRAVRVVAAPVGDDGWRGWPQTGVFYCTLARLGPQWRVAGYTLAPLDGTP